MSFPFSGASWVAEVVAVARQSRLKRVFVANKGAVDFWLWVCDSPHDRRNSPDARTGIRPGELDAIARCL